MQGKVNKRLVILIGLVLTVMIVAGVIFGFGSSGWFGDFDDFGNGALSGEVYSGEVSSGEFVSQVSGDEIEYTSYSLTKQVGNVQFSNIRVGKVKIRKCLFEADIENVSDKLQLGRIVNISTIDENEEVKEIFSGFLDDLPGNGKGTFKTQVLSDITYAKDFKIEVVNQ